MIRRCIVSIVTKNIRLVISTPRMRVFILNLYCELLKKSYSSSSPYLILQIAFQSDIISTFSKIIYSDPLLSKDINSSGSNLSLPINSSQWFMVLVRLSQLNFYCVWIINLRNQFVITFVANKRI